MSKNLSRRKFLKGAIVTCGGLTAIFASVRFDAKDGIKVGKSSVSIGVSEAHASCGRSSDCSGGGGECGRSSDCSGGGGACGRSSDCSGQ